MYFVWDWNGTLLDDLALSMHALNVTLKSEDMEEMWDVEAYRRLFQFPVIEYYRKAGFDFKKTPFEVLAKRYMDDYQPNSIDAPLFKDALKCLDKINDLGYDQYLLSASDRSYLDKQLSSHQLQPRFKKIYGLNHIHAYSKESLAHLLMEEEKLDASQVCFIGDSVHDYEVASSVKANCILIADGHEHVDKLKACGCQVYDTLDDFYQNYLLKL